MALFEKHFTLEEAQRWVPELRLRFEHIHEVLRAMESAREHAEDFARTTGGNGHGEKGDMSPIQDLVAKIEHELAELAEAGIQVKDVERGLVDFPHWRHDEEVFLCWEFGEPEIRFWHRIEDGFPGRQALD